MGRRIEIEEDAKTHMNVCADVTLVAFRFEAMRQGGRGKMCRTYDNDPASEESRAEDIVREEHRHRYQKVHDEANSKARRLSLIHI